MFSRVSKTDTHRQSLLRGDTGKTRCLGMGKGEVLLASIWRDSQTETRDNELAE